MLKTFTKLLGGSNDSVIKKLQHTVDEINALEPDFERLSDDELRAKRQEFIDRYQDGEELDDLLPEAFAAVREASKRTLGMRHFDVQLIGGIVLHQGLSGPHRIVAQLFRLDGEFNVHCRIQRTPVAQLQAEFQIRHKLHTIGGRAQYNAVMMTAETTPV